MFCLEIKLHIFQNPAIGSALYEKQEARVIALVSPPGCC